MFALSASPHRGRAVTRPLSLGLPKSLPLVGFFFRDLLHKLKHQKGKKMCMRPSKAPRIEGHPNKTTKSFRRNKTI